MVELLTLNLENLVASRRWIVADEHLIMMPQQTLSDHSDRVLARIGATKLERPPRPEDLNRFTSIIVVESGTPTAQDEDLKVQSLWLGNGPWANMGAIFPELRPNLTNYQTLRGLLYPHTVNLSQIREVDDTPTLESWLQAVSPKRIWCLTRLLSPRKQAKSLEALLRPESSTRRLGIYGIGDIGSIVAARIREEDVANSHISEIYIGGSRSKEKVEAQIRELRDINLEGIHQPLVHPVYKGEEEKFFRECDVVLILVASDIIPPENTGSIDVRLEQYQRNVELVTQLVEKASDCIYDGQILIGSDPIEQLAMTTYRFLKERVDINTHQIVGFGGMINRSRAKALADERGDIHFQDSGRTYGPHGKMLVAFPTHDSRYYDVRVAESLSLAAGHANLEIRKLLAKPHLGPAMLIAQGIMEMHQADEITKRGGIIYASPFLPADDPTRHGAFFGTRVEFHRFPGAWTPRVEQPYLDQIMHILDRAHLWTEVTSANPQAMQTDPFTFGATRHPAFHPYMMETWLEKVSASDER